MKAKRRKKHPLLSLNAALADLSLVEAETSFAVRFKIESVKQVFGGNLRVLLGLRNLNMHQLSEKTKVDVSVISRLATSTANTSLYTALKISSALGVKLTTMLDVNLVELFDKTIHSIESQQI